MKFCWNQNTLQSHVNFTEICFQWQKMGRRSMTVKNWTFWHVLIGVFLFFFSKCLTTFFLFYFDLKDQSQNETVAKLKYLIQNDLFLETSFIGNFRLLYCIDFCSFQIDCEVFHFYSPLIYSYKKNMMSMYHRKEGKPSLQTKGFQFHYIKIAHQHLTFNKLCHSVMKQLRTYSIFQYSLSCSINETLIFHIELM